VAASKATGEGPASKNAFPNSEALPSIKPEPIEATGKPQVKAKVDVEAVSKVEPRGGVLGLVRKASRRGPCGAWR
jgi:hypothetical protein